MSFLERSGKMLYELLVLHTVVATVLASVDRPQYAPRILASVDRPQYICLSGIGVGQLPTQAQISATLTNLSGVQRSSGGLRRLCLSEQWSVLGAGANTTKMAEQVDEFLALALANDLPVSISVDATQWWESAEHIWNWWNSSRLVPPPPFPSMPSD